MNHLVKEETKPPRLHLSVEPPLLERRRGIFRFRFLGRYKLKYSFPFLREEPVPNWIGYELDVIKEGRVYSLSTGEALIKLVNT